MHQTATTWERDLFLRRAANNPNRRPPPRLQIPQQDICLNRRLPPEAQKGPGITASGRTVVTRTIVGTVKCAIAIDPARDGPPCRNAVALSAFLADNPSVFGQCRSRHGACLIEKRHRERGRRPRQDCHGRQRQSLHRDLHRFDRRSIARLRPTTTRCPLTTHRPVAGEMELTKKPPEGGSCSLLGRSSEAEGMLILTA